tara:strand:+ start:50271 stop:51272 length:1002 start_codon:yes stop_codon:yes gene_type:complete
MCTSPSVLAQGDEDGSLLGDDFRVGYDAEINMNGTTSNRNGEAGNFNDSFVSLHAEWKNKVRLVLTGKLEELFKSNKVEFTDDFDLAAFVEEAYIEIREINGSPIAIVIGKQPIPFGNDIKAMPIFRNNPLANLQDIDEVFGVTVDLTEGLFGIFDQAEVSVFETEAGDLEVGRIDGVSVRLSKMLKDNWLLTLSHAEQGNNHLNTGHERRSSIGIVGTSTDGMLVGWAEGMFFSNNPEYPNADFGLTVGAMVRVHRTTDVIVEYSYIEKEVSQIALGVRTALTARTTLGFEVRYNDFEDKSDELVFGLNLNYAIGSGGYKPNEHYIFGKDND